MKEFTFKIRHVYSSGLFFKHNLRFLKLLYYGESIKWIFEVFRALAPLQIETSLNTADRSGGKLLG